MSERKWITTTVPFTEQPCGFKYDSGGTHDGGGGLHVFAARGGIMKSVRTRDIVTAMHAAWYSGPVDVGAEVSRLVLEMNTAAETGQQEDFLHPLVIELARLRDVEAIRVAEIEAVLDKHRAAFGVDMTKVPAALDEAAELAEHIDVLDRTDVSEADFDRALTRTIIIVRKMLREPKPCDHTRFPLATDASTYCTDCGADVERSEDPTDKAARELGEMPEEAFAAHVEQTLGTFAGTREATLARLPADIRAQVLAQPPPEPDIETAVGDVVLGCGGSYVAKEIERRSGVRLTLTCEKDAGHEPPCGPVQRDEIDG